MSNLLKESALAWYKKVYAWKEPQTKNEEAMLSAMVDVAESLVTDMFQAKACYRKIFAVLVLIAVLAANCYQQFMLFKRF